MCAVSYPSLKSVNLLVEFRPPPVSCGGCSQGMFLKVVFFRTLEF